MILQFDPIVKTENTDAYDEGVYVSGFITIDGVELRDYLGCSEDVDVRCYGVFPASEVGLGDVSGCTLAADVEVKRVRPDFISVETAKNFRIVRTKAENDARSKKTMQFLSDLLV